MQASLDDHLHLPGLPKQFAVLADAHLMAEGQLVPVHKAVLAVASPVFSDLFASATESNNPEEAQCFPMPGHTAADICMTLLFLYGRACSSLVDTPSNDLWVSVEHARPIVQFVHKFDMQSVLQDIDACLSAKATADSDAIFRDDDITVAWAILAEEHGLQSLLAHAELFMVKSDDPLLWENPALHQLSSSCMLRMLRAAQVNMKDWDSQFIPGLAQNQEWAKAVCDICHSSVWCSKCSVQRYSRTKPVGTHVSVPTLISWQHSSTAADGA